MIGKWHLGYHKWEYTPTYRGFDTFYGFYNGWGDHYSHEIDNILDLRDNKEAVRDLNGTFATFAFSKVIMLFELTWMIVFSVSIKATACPSIGSLLPKNGQTEEFIGGLCQEEQ